LLSLLGAALAFLAGLVALKWLSRWLESGRWYLFGVYCLIAALAVTLLHHNGY
jgi:undecaprenyl-diphosphatase